ncbi:MAG: thiamine-phosphate kinase [Rhodospirillaceae bacterium]|jgi:thiamine-monophosphate kinase|nr:thiamine-phosphate kinase [Rhodospirillaceae bacterium]
MLKTDEFSIISDIFAPLTKHYSGALELTDDAALIDAPNGHQWVITTDSIVEGIHFLKKDSPDLIARKLVRVNLSDLAAMGAKPFAILLATCFSKDITKEWVELFASGIKRDCEEFSLVLIGGDTVATNGPLTFTMTAIGSLKTQSALLRSNARLGDDIWVSGTIGDAAFGLMIEQNEIQSLDLESKNQLLSRYQLPLPRTSLGQSLVGIAHAAIDISDGLVGDLEHICKTSSVGAEIKITKIPLSDAVKKALKFGNIERVLTGGDDYELLFSASFDQVRSINIIGQELGLRLTIIGKIKDQDGVSVIEKDGHVISLKERGYQHF